MPAADELTLPHSNSIGCFDPSTSQALNSFEQSSTTFVNLDANVPLSMHEQDTGAYGTLVTEGLEHPQRSDHAYQLDLCPNCTDSL